MKLHFVILAALATPGLAVAETTAADHRGPDGILYPDFSRAGIPGGIPDVPVVVRAEDFDLPGNGESDAAPAIQAAIDRAAEQGGGAVELPAGRFIIDSTLQLSTPGIVLRGQGPEATVLSPRFQSGLNGHQAVISIAPEGDGRRLDSQVTGPIRRGDVAIQVESIEGFQPGDVIVLTAEPPASVVAHLEEEGREHLTKGTYGSIYSYQYFRVTGTENGILQVDRPVRLDLAPGQKPVVRMQSMLERCGVEDLSIVQDVDLRDIHGISLSRTDRCHVRNVRVERIGDWPLSINRSFQFEIRDSVFDTSRSRGGARAYLGLSFAGDGLMADTTIRQLRHFSPQLSSNGNVFLRCKIRNVDINLHFHWPYENLFDSCDVVEGPGPGEQGHGSYGWGIYTPDFRGGGHNPAGPRNAFFNNRITSNWSGVMLGGGGTAGTIVAYNYFNVAQSAGAVIKPGSEGSIFIGNVFVLSDPHRRKSGPAYAVEDARRLVGAVLFPRGAPDGMHFEGNRFYGAPQEGIFAPDVPAIDRDNQSISPWPLAAGAPPEGAVSLAGDWRILETVRIDGAETPEERHPDPGISDEARAAARSTADRSGWATLKMPQMLGGEPVDWEKNDGEIVLWREFDLPAELTQTDIDLSLGVLDDSDITWVNGVQIGETAGPDAWRTPRHYTVPAGTLRPGRNEIAIRLWDEFGGGGMAGISGDLWIGPKGIELNIDLPEEIAGVKPPVPSLFEWQKNARKHSE